MQKKSIATGLHLSLGHGRIVLPQEVSLTMKCHNQTL